MDHDQSWLEYDLDFFSQEYGREEERWFLREMDQRDDLIARSTGEHRLFDDWAYDPSDSRADLMEECDRLFGNIYHRKCAGPWNVTAASPADVKIRHGQPQLKRRQIHPLRYKRYHRALRLDLSCANESLQAVRRRVSEQDMQDQIDDCLADLVTDVPSVGTTTYISYFARNVGEYPRAEYECGDFADDYDLDDEEFEPAWMREGFDSEAEYEEYLRAYGDLYEEDWRDPSYYDEAAKLDDENGSSDANQIVFSSEEQHDKYHRVFSAN